MYKICLPTSLRFNAKELQFFSFRLEAPPTKTITENCQNPSLPVRRDVEASCIAGLRQNHKLRESLPNSETNSSLSIIASAKRPHPYFAQLLSGSRSCTLSLHPMQKAHKIRKTYLTHTDSSVQVTCNHTFAPSYCMFLVHLPPRIPLPLRSTADDTWHPRVARRKRNKAELTCVLV